MKDDEDKVRRANRNAGKIRQKSRKGLSKKRQDRLKLALRENLKRRKSQARERDKMIAQHLAGTTKPYYIRDGAKKPGK